MRYEMPILHMANSAINIVKGNTQKGPSSPETGQPVTSAYEVDE
jgi:hypothetical protein